MRAQVFEKLDKTITTRIPVAFFDSLAHHQTQAAFFGGSYEMDVPLPPSPDPPPMRRGANRPCVPEISRETVIDLVADMNRVGFGVLPGYLEPADIEDLRQFIETAVAAAGGEYAVFTGEETIAGTLLKSLLRELAAPSLRARFRSLGAESITLPSPALLKLKQIRMVPGNLYLFWGYRSVHANEACDPDKIRATALFHFGDPHADSGLRRFTGRAKSRSRIGSFQSP